MTTIVREMESAGFLFLRAWNPQLTTEHAADRLGELLDIQRLLPGSAVPSIQTLAPKPADDAPANQYSGTFGLGEFPLHSDLAHWAVPPRYFMLRCLRGLPSVSTQLLPVEAVAAAVGHRSIRKAVFLPRKRASGVPRCPLPMLFQRGGATGVRWDSLFLRPFNRSASDVSLAMSGRRWGKALRSVALVHPGDTLIIDNWRMLHGRSSVDQCSTGRSIERAYLRSIEG